MATQKELLRARLKQAEAGVARLTQAIQELKADGSPDQALDLGEQLKIAEARRDALKEKLDNLHADEARKVAEMEAEDRRGLLAIYDERGGNLAGLPRALQRRIRDAYRERSEQKLVRGAWRGLPGFAG